MLYKCVECGANVKSMICDICGTRREFNYRQFNADMGFNDVFDNLKIRGTPNNFKNVIIDSYYDNANTTLPKPLFDINEM